jgi:Na+-translocating ferredoxin:NAD+ oxidoreductase RnfG subunit
MKYLTIFAICVSFTLTAFSEEKNITYLAKRLAGKSEVKETSGLAGSQKIKYFTVEKNGKATGYIFRSQDFVKGIKGYKDELKLLVYVDSQGKLLNFAILKARETRYYLNKVLKRRSELNGKDIFKGETGFKGGHVTRATYTSKALVKTLNESGKKFKAFLGGEKINVTSADSVMPPPGGPREINAARYKNLIVVGKLSDRTALYWKKH